MSLRFITKIWDCDLEPIKMLVLQALGDCGDDEGCNVYPSVPYLAWQTNLSERTVQRYLSVMREEGSLIVDEGGKGGRGLFTVYRINLEHLKKKTQWKSVRNGVSVASFPSLKKGDTVSAKGDSLSAKGDTDGSAIRKNLFNEPVREPDTAKAENFKPLTDLIGKSYLEATGKKLDWTPRAFKVLKTERERFKSLDLSDWIKAFENWTQSDNINPAELPEFLIPKLPRYLAGPLAFGGLKSQGQRHEQRKTFAEQSTSNIDAAAAEVDRRLEKRYAAAAGEGDKQNVVIDAEDHAL